MLFCYDYILTFSREVKCIWSRKVSAAVVLFFINRYVVLANRLIRLIQLYDWHGHREIQADQVRIESVSHMLADAHVLLSLQA